MSWAGPWIERSTDAAATFSPEHAVEMWLLAAATVTIIGFGLAPVTGAAGAVAVLAGGPVALRVARHRRERLVAAAVPGTLEHVGAALRAGETIPTSVSSIARAGGPLAADFARLEATGPARGVASPTHSGPGRASDRGSASR